MTTFLYKTLTAPCKTPTSLFKITIVHYKTCISLYKTCISLYKTTTSLLKTTTSLPKPTTSFLQPHTRHLSIAEKQTKSPQSLEGFHYIYLRELLHYFSIADRRFPGYFVFFFLTSKEVISRSRCNKDR